MPDNNSRFHLRSILLFLFTLFCFLHVSGSSNRYPQPEFETGYEIPAASVVSPKSTTVSGSGTAERRIDIITLLAVLSAAAYAIYIKRSRTLIFIIAVISLFWFGFYRKGCVCAVGSLQNVVLSFLDSTYVLPVGILAFFVIPLITALILGRIFCSAVCPLGAIQELVIIRPVHLPVWLNRILGFIPALYLAAACTGVYTGTGFLICRYDPFVSLFRMSGQMPMIIFGLTMLGAGTVIARPYCRFLCPYSVLLKLASGVSRNRLSITKKECVPCGLCAPACPVQAINPPADAHAINMRIRSFIIIAAITPVIIALCGWGLGFAEPFFSSLHPSVRLHTLLSREAEKGDGLMSLETQTYQVSGANPVTLAAEVETVRRRAARALRITGWLLGLYISLRSLMFLRSAGSTRYEADPSECVQCGRCFEYCPRK